MTTELMTSYQRELKTVSVQQPVLYSLSLTNDIFQRKIFSQNLIINLKNLCQISTNPKIGTNSLYLQILESILKMRTHLGNEE